MIIRIVDLESTGLPPDAAICEVATVDLVGDGRVWTRGRMWSSLINPQRPIPPEVSAVHHLTDEDVQDAPTWGSVSDKLIEGDDGKPLPDPIMLCAHNARFEQSFFSVGGARWICSWRVAVTLWPEAPSHKNQVLKYWLGLKLDPKLSMPPHRSGPDAYTTAAILRHALRNFEIDIDWMVEVSSRPVVLPRFHFGEHAGKPIAEIDTGYLEWIVKPGKKKPFDDDTLHTAAVELHRRKTASRSRSPVDLEAGRAK